MAHLVKGIYDEQGGQNSWSRLINAVFVSVLDETTPNVSDWDGIFHIRAEEDRQMLNTVLERLGKITPERVKGLGYITRDKSKPSGWRVTRKGYGWLEEIFGN